MQAPHAVTPTPQTYRGILLTYLAPLRARVAVLTVLMAATAGLPLATPQIVREFIDTATTSGPTRRLFWLAAGYIALAVAGQLVAVASAWLTERIGWRATNNLRADLARHALRLDMPFHNRHTPGAMIERIDGDVTALSTFGSQFASSVVVSGGMLTGAIVLVWFVDWRVGAALAGYVAVVLMGLTPLREVAVPHAAELRAASAGLFGFVEERLAGLDDIRTAGAGAYVMRRFAQTGRDYYRSALRAQKAGTWVWIATTGMFTLGYALTLGLGAWLFRRGQVTIGTVYLLFQYTQILRRPLELIADQLKEFQRAGAGLRRAIELFRRTSAIRDGDHARLPDGALSVSFDRVAFAYDRDEPVLSDVSFELGAGRVLGVLGRTGSGKTTLARLLVRLYDVGDGAVVLGGTDVRAVPLADLRHRVGVVTQDVQLFNASVRDNLLLFGRVPGDDRILDVLADLGLLDWYASLPDGLETELGPAGVGLSAGEAQLLAFARVFLRDPGLVILDEASSRLDPATESLIEHAVDRLLDGRTGIVIAHRLSTVERADEILILDSGRLEEYGDRAALAADARSRFYSLRRTGLEEVLA